jgi:hypothetical protein
MGVTLSAIVFYASRHREDSCLLRDKIVDQQWLLEGTSYISDSFKSNILRGQRIGCLQELIMKSYY